jgi:hypothetical protein
MCLVEINLAVPHQDNELKQLGFVRERPDLYNYTKYNVFVDDNLCDIRIATKIVEWKRYITDVKISRQYIGDILSYHG